MGRRASEFDTSPATFVHYVQYSRTPRKLGGHSEDTAEEIRHKNVCRGRSRAIVETMAQFGLKLCELYINDRL